MEEKFDSKLKLKEIFNMFKNTSGASEKSDSQIKEEIRVFIENNIAEQEKSIEFRDEMDGTIAEINRQVKSKKIIIERLKQILEVLNKEIAADKSKPENTEQMVEKILKEAQKKYPIPESQKDEEIEL